MGTSTNYLILKELAGNPPPVLGPIQQALLPHATLITQVWILLWALVAWFMLSKLILIIYRTHRSREH